MGRGLNLTTSTLALGMALLPAIAHADSMVIKHAKGETILDAPPRKVAIFDLASLDTIAALGMGEVIAGVPKGEKGEFNAPAYLAQFGDAAIAGVGTLFEPDLAALTALQPDLIIIAGRSAGKYDDVKTIAPTIDMSAKGQDFLAETVQNATTLGQIFDREALAAEKVAELTAAVEAMQAAAPKDAKGIVVFAVNDNYMLHAPGARFGGLLDLAGIAPVMDPHVPPPANAPRPERPAAGSPEAEAARLKQVAARDAELAKNPDWLITLDRGAISSAEPSDIADRMARIEAFAATPAMKEGHVIHLDPRAWYLVGGGLQNMLLTAEQMKAAYQAD